jgi:SAM-dependent methyltransferase
MIIDDYIKPNTGYSEHLDILKDAEQFIKDVITDYKTDKQDLKFLDVGGGSGRHKTLATGFDYHITDITPRPNSPKNIVVADICNCPEIPDNTYDIVFSNNVWEHLERPWDAGRESVRILKEGGLVICKAPWAWRYHPVPIDGFRFSHTGLQILFTQDKNVETVFAGYDLCQWRDNIKGFWRNGLDKTVCDSLGGWRENWFSVYVGRKTNKEIIEKLDADFSVNH